MRNTKKYRGRDREIQRKTEKEREIQRKTEGEPYRNKNQTKKKKESEQKKYIQSTMRER